MSGYERYNPYEGATVDGLKKRLREWAERVDRLCGNREYPEQPCPSTDCPEECHELAAEMRKEAGDER